MVGIAGKMMDAMVHPGGVYTKCGVLLEDLTAEGAGQADLLATADPKAPALLAAMDGLNSRFGRNTVILAAQGCGARSFDTKRSQKSPAWTRSEERRVGQACVSTCRYRWSPDHQKKKKKK